MMNESPSACARNLLFGFLFLMAAMCMRATPIAFVAPGTNTFAEGNNNNCFPFGTGPLPTLCVETMRYQQVYGSGEFPGQTISIESIGLRQDSFFGGPFSTTFSSVRISLSTTSVGPDGLSSMFAANVGVDELIVFSGALTVSSSGTVGVFDTVVPFQNAFVYDSTGGNLLLDVSVFGVASSIGNQAFDAVRFDGDSVSRVFSGLVDAETGFIDSDGLVTQFRGRLVNATEVPEPAAIGSLILGLIPFIARKSFSRRR